MKSSEIDKCKIIKEGFEDFAKNWGKRKIISGIISTIVLLICCVFLILKEILLS
jgi:hypothetical protein